MSTLDTIPLIFVEEDIEGGGKEGATHGIQNDFAYNNNVQNADIKIRMGFLRKVYGLLSIQLFLTVVVGTIFMSYESVKQFMQTNNWILGMSFLSTMAIIIALHMKKRDHPANLILLAAFTLIQASTVGVIVTMYDTAVVLEALLITLTVAISLTAYTFQTKRDFSFMTFGLFAGLCALLVGGVIQMFMQNSILELGISIGGALLFCLFIIYDTQLLMYTLSPEEYILATVNIYLDIINLFLYILRAVAAARQ